MSEEAVSRFNGAVKRVAANFIQALGIVTSMINNLAVTTAKLAALAVTRAKMGTESLENVFHTLLATYTVNTTLFFGFAGEPLSPTESIRQIPALRPGNIKRLKLRITSNILSVDATVTVRINGGDTAMVLTVLAGVNSIVTDTQDIAVVEDDLISIEMTSGAGTGTCSTQAQLEVAYNNA